ncbi:MAG: hypothetical protein AABN95_20945 [Acidobacteriota bacterium]
MNDHLTVESCDPLLQPFLRATDANAAENLLAQLILEHADPVISKIIKSKMRVSLDVTNGDRQNQDALEMAGDLRATLISDLRSVQNNPTRKTITSFRNYVAIKTYSACADYFREMNPRRWRLKNLLRYQLKQNQRFALWKVDNNYWCAGFSEWRDMQGSGNLLKPLPPAESIRDRLLLKPTQDTAAIELLTAVFEHVGHPVQFERVVSLAAEVWRITDFPADSIDDPDQELASESVSSTPRVDLVLEQRIYLERLWTEVCQLPRLQRVALLLTLRDAQGGSAIFFIPHLGISSKEQLAEALELSDAEFAALWVDLPLEDAEIAQRLKITRQQVINLRKTARERLARRMDKAR